MLLRQIINPVYLVGRLQVAWWEKLHPDLPWMSPGAVRFLEGFLKKSDVGIEFGSGRSTLWFARHSHHLTSVEHDTKWATIVKGMIQEAGVDNIEYHPIPLDHPEEEPHRKFYDPLPKYVDLINQYPDGHFDFVIVDGHYRVACIAAAVAKLKVGGILILDNSDWLPLKEWGIPDNFRILHRSRNVKSETTIFLKSAGV